MFRHAHIHQVLNPALWIEPVSRLDLPAAAEAQQNRIGYIPLRKPDFRGALAIYIHGKARTISGLLHPNIHRTRHPPDMLGKFSGQSTVAGDVAAHDLNVERGGKTEIERLAHNIRR